MNNKLNFQTLFEGFQNTAALWIAGTIYDLEQYNTKSTTESFVLNTDNKRLRLGLWVEKFVSFQLRQDPEVSILAENLQIRANKITIGELDVLLQKNNKPIHLEIVYKFYLYDTTQNYSNPLEHWIGPNRKDSLIYKLNKLKEKQLPLLYHQNTAETLNYLNLDLNSFKQQVCFKAQLFLPFKSDAFPITPLNPSCISGWYINYDDIEILKDYQIYIPQKLEWLSTPNHQVSWLAYKEAKQEIYKQIKSERSPLCWIKNEKNKIEKCFITWW